MGTFSRRRFTSATGGLDVSRDLGGMRLPLLQAFAIPIRDEPPALDDPALLRIFVDDSEPERFGDNVIYADDLIEALLGRGEAEPAN